MIDALFGSKTRVKLLHLFLNNPGKSFYVREITRIIDEQINSVRRELSNMMDIGIVVSDSSDNKLYYQVNQRYEYYVPLKAIFGDGEMAKVEIHLAEDKNKYESLFDELSGLRLVIYSGILVKGSNVPVDIVVVGNVSALKIKSLVKEIEQAEGREINYSLLGYDEFYYRLSVRDKFIMQILNGAHKVIIDKDKILDKS
jgi:hypothetical protein